MGNLVVSMVNLPQSRYRIRVRGYDRYCVRMMRMRETRGRWMGVLVAGGKGWSKPFDDWSEEYRCFGYGVRW